MIGAQLAGLYGTGAAPANTAYESIATVSLSGAQSTIDFTGISSTYKHLQLRGILLNAVSGDNVAIRLGNGSIDTGSNYASHQLQGDGSSASAAASTSQTAAYLSGVCQASSSYPFAFVYDILDYSNTNKYKTIRGLSGQDGNGTGTPTSWRVQLISGLWQSTSAVTNVRVYLPAGNLGNYSQVALYGIKG